MYQTWRRSNGEAARVPSVLDLAPEEPAAVVVDVLDELVDMWRRRGEVVLVELAVLVTPLERPLSPHLRVPKSTDREPRPLRANVSAPRRSAFEQRDVPVGDVNLVADLLANVRLHLVVATVGPSLDPSDIQIGKHGGHATETRIAGQSNQTTLTFMSVGHRADVCHMSQLVETRWTRYGKDRVYVRDEAGDEIGHVDLKERTIAVKAKGYEASLEECLRRWTSNDPFATQVEPQPKETGQSGAAQLPPPPAAPPPSDPPAPLPTAEDDLSPPAAPESKDLVANVAGAAARAERDRVNSQAPVINFVARVFGVKTDERAWRVGAKGEEKVARELAKLGPGWHYLHAVEVGDRGSDIDHVVIGPPGVITINTKRHPGGKAWVGERTVMVNGQKTDYLRNSRFEAKRAARLLSAACGKPIDARAAIVFVDLDDFNLKQMPSDVHVTTRRRLIGWLRSLPVVASPATIEEIFGLARVSTTWCGSNVQP